ncbi:MAG: SEC-C domain-containing protein [Polyangia bacterium]
MQTLSRGPKRSTMALNINKGKDPIALVRKLVPDGKLTEDERQAIAELRAQGEPAVDALLACALTPRLGGLTGLPYIDANATRAKAIYALGLLSAERAIEPLLSALAATKPHSAERGFLGSCCCGLGALALEPALRLCKTSPLGPSDALLVLLAQLGVRDERILDLLTGFLPINPAAAARLLAIYGDPEALPALRAQLEQARVAPDALKVRDAEYLSEAIQKLAGEAATPAPAADPAPARAQAKKPAQSPGPRAQSRNERCACGSGKKYKACCYLRS